MMRPKKTTEGGQNQKQSLEEGWNPKNHFRLAVSVCRCGKGSREWWNRNVRPCRWLQLAPGHLFPVRPVSVFMFPLASHLNYFQEAFQGITRHTHSQAHTYQLSYSDVWLGTGHKQTVTSLDTQRLPFLLPQLARFVYTTPSVDRALRAIFF